MKPNPILLHWQTIVYFSTQAEVPTRVLQSKAYLKTWRDLQPPSWSAHSLTTERKNVVDWHVTELRLNLPTQTWNRAKKLSCPILMAMCLLFSHLCVLGLLPPLLQRGLALSPPLKFIQSCSYYSQHFEMKSQRKLQFFKNCGISDRQWSRVNRRFILQIDKCM